LPWLDLVGFTWIFPFLRAFLEIYSNRPTNKPPQNIADLLYIDWICAHLRNLRSLGLPSACRAVALAKADIDLPMAKLRQLRRRTAFAENLKLNTEN
jgi:hypothetical protein